MKLLTIIPARSGSKGIPGKNIKVLGNKPLIAYSIEAALTATSAMDVIVDTDSGEIASVAMEFGAQVPFLRPHELAEDHTPTVEVVLHALGRMEELGFLYDEVLLLQPTSPFRAPGFIDRCIDEFRKGKYDSLVSVLPVPHEFNPHWVFELGDDNSLHIATGDERLIARRQELPTAWYRDGAVYLARVDALKAYRQMVAGRIGYVPSDSRYYCNLDTLDDWQHALKLFGNLTLT